MIDPPRKISLAAWDARYEQLHAAGLAEPWYGGPLRRHLADGDERLASLQFDDSPAALRLWNFLLTEEDRLHEARAAGKKIVGVMKDLGTAAVMAFALPNVVAFYPDGAWWIPCILEGAAGRRTSRLGKTALAVADSLGVDESFCPVRAMLGAFLTEGHFPIPDLLTCSVGATCDDFSAIAQRLASLGYPILWWEIPHRRRPDADELAVRLPGGFDAPASQVAFVQSQLDMVRQAMEKLAGHPLDDARLADGIRQANRARGLLAELRTLCFKAEPAPLPALEMLIAEMLAIHYCSDPAETIAIFEQLLAEVRRRVAGGVGPIDAGAARIFWVNPVADLRAMNLLEDCGGRVCGTEFLFCHALDPIPQDCPPMEALARTALADTMAGPSSDRADRICRDIAAFGAEGVVISRVPGASHCAMEGIMLAEIIRSRMGLPVVEIEVPSVCDPMAAGLRTRLEALAETIREHRRT